MPTTTTLLAFAAVCLGFVLSPGPNMMYIVSRSVCQGPLAGLISLGGIACAFVIYMICAALGISALLLTVPYAYDALRLAGAAYLAYLAWKTLKPGGRAPFEVRELPRDTPRRLFAMGFLTNLLNPKAAVLYLSLLPQFIRPEDSVLLQSFVLCLVQFTISMTVNAMIALGAGSIAGFLGTRPSWLAAQRWLMGGVLSLLALRMATESRR